MSPNGMRLFLFRKSMGYESFDVYATEYDSWFIENRNVLESEVKLVASCLKDAGDVLSIGCGFSVAHPKSDASIVITVINFIIFLTIFIKSPRI